MKTKQLLLIPIILCINLILSESAKALPAFAMRENVSCTLCHTNGSAPHLTKTGYLYRRAGFRFPTYIGNLEKDNDALKALLHLAVGVNADYNVVDSQQAQVAGQPPVPSEGLTANNFDMREAEIWPLIGAFFGNYAFWSEVDFTPSTVGGSGGASLADTELRYIWGDEHTFYSIRAGFIAAEGYGASDQGIDDGNIPLFDTLAAQYNGINTLSLPLGAFNNPELGFEFQGNLDETHFTAGIYNGFDGSNTLAASQASVAAGTGPVASTSSPQYMNPNAKGAKDYKLQVDQFLGDKLELTGVYYNGTTSLLDPSGTVVWVNNYALWRLYGTYAVVPNVVDAMAGLAQGTYNYVNSGSNTVAGAFRNIGAFVGGNYYVKPHLTFSARYDYFDYSYGTTPAPRAIAYVLMASLPYDNNMFVFHFNRTQDDVAGLSNDFRAEWRFLF